MRPIIAKIDYLALWWFILCIVGYIIEDHIYPAIKNKKSKNKRR